MSVTGTANVYVPASTRYFIKNGQPVEGGSWKHISSEDSGSYTVENNYLKLSTLNWVYDSSTKNSYIKIATLNTVFDLSDIKNKYSHVYYDYYVERAGYVNNSSDEVSLHISFDKNQVGSANYTTLVSDNFNRDEVGVWKRGSYTVPKMDSGRYYLIVYSHGSSNNHGIIRISNVWLSSD